MKDLSLNNCMHCENGILSFLFTDFVYFDVKDEFSKQMLYDHKIRVLSLKKAMKQGAAYDLYLARVWKKDVEKFLDVMEQLEKRIIILGHPDYLDYCKNFFSKLGTEKKGKE